MIVILMRLYLFLLIYIKVLHENYYNINNYLVQARFQARCSRIKLPDIHGVRKNLHPNIKPEKQHANPIKCSVVSLA